MADAKGAVPPSHADTTEQPTLRVMRLYKPRLDTRRVLPSCCFGGYSGEGLGLAPAGAATGTAVGSRGAGDFALSTALKLPDSFGNIYLGETFTAYISVLNHMSATVLTNASLSAKLQSPSARVDLEDRRMARGASVSRPNPAPSLSPAENLDMIVEHTLEELGTHTLRVTVKFDVAGAPEGSEPRTMRKFYRFSVMNPVSMSSACTSIRGNPFVELQLQNTTQMDLLLESCDFIPERGVVASLIGAGIGGRAATLNEGVADAKATHQTAPAKIKTPQVVAKQTGEEVAGRKPTRNIWWRGDGKGLGEGIERDGHPSVEFMTAVERFDGRVLLRPQESHQLMYSVRAAIPAGFDGVEHVVGERGFGEGSHTLGQVELCWRTTTGESGSVRSAPVVFDAPDRPEVEVTVDHLPDVLQLGRVAECVATVHNRSARSMTLQLQFRTDGMVGVYVHGQSFRNVGELAPGTSIRCPLQLLALVAGLHELRGCTVADMHTAQEFPQGKLRDVLVEFPNEQEEETAFVEGKRGEMLRS